MEIHEKGMGLEGRKKGGEGGQKKFFQGAIESIIVTKCQIQPGSPMRAFSPTGSIASSTGSSTDLVASQPCRSLRHLKPPPSHQPWQALPNDDIGSRGTETPNHVRCSTWRVVII